MNLSFDPIVRSRLKRIRGKIGGARLLIACKNQPIERIVRCIEAGEKLFGENREQELKTKWSSPDLRRLRNKIELHFVGHLQTNKAREVCRMVNAIESVDSIKLAKVIDAECEKIQKKMSIFLEVNVTGEVQKYGFKPTELKEAIAEIRNLKHLEIRGLLCLAKLDASEDELRKTFGSLREMGKEHGLKELSMGMSDDFEIAVEEGSTLVRLGRKIFE